MNDEDKQGQGHEAPPDPFSEIDSFILGLTPKQLKDSSLEDAPAGKKISSSLTSCTSKRRRGDKSAIG